MTGIKTGVSCIAPRLLPTRSSCGSVADAYFATSYQRKVFIGVSHIECGSRFGAYHG